MILAAGRGERLRPITDDKPKPLVEVGGVSLIERHLAVLAGAGVDTVVINLGWKGEQIVERIGSGERYGCRVVYSPEYDHVLETGGGIHRALPMLGGEPFWVVNGDIYSEYVPGERAFAPGRLGHLVLVPRPDHRPRGDFDLEDGLVAVGDDPGYTFSGVACYRAELFADCRPGRFPLAPLLRAAAGEGRLTGELYEGRWTDVGTPERLARLERELGAGAT